MVTYETNADFRAYVDKYMKKERIDLEEALSHAVVENYRHYIFERGKDEVKLPNMWGSAGAAHENMADI